MESSRSEVTRLLQQWTDGRQNALDRLVPQVYAELRRLSSSYLAAKRGAGGRPVSLDETLVVTGAPDFDLLALDEVLTRLAAIDPQQSRVVELRFFGGLTMEETAEVMHISPATVGREWTLAKAWLYAELQGSAR